MKIRSNYVSNSSSSSFIVNKDLTGRGINCARIDFTNVFHIASRKMREMFFNRLEYGKIDKEYIDEINWLLKNADSLYITEMLEESYDLTRIDIIKKAVRYQCGEGNKPYGTNYSHIIKEDRVHPVWMCNYDEPVIDDEMPMVELIQKISDKYGDYASVSIQDDIMKIAKKVQGAEYL